jgi:hypothetical protein
MPGRAVSARGAGHALVTGPGIRPGAPPLLTRQAQVAPLVLACVGLGHGARITGLG